MFWTLDPIDGTKGFLRGQQYAIALARIEGGRVTHGIMGCPNLSVDPQRAVEAADPIGVVFSASDGGGAWQWPTNGTDREGQPIHAKSGPADVARICSSVERSHSSQDDQQRVLEHLGLRVEPLRLDSQGKYGIVARGQADAYLRLPTRASYVERIWDHAAGSLIATEAGAVVSDITGATLDFSHGSGLEANRGVVCANRSLHGRLIEALRDLNIASPV